MTWVLSYQAQLLSGLYLVSSIALKDSLKEQNIKHIIFLTRMKLILNHYIVSKDQIYNKK